MASVFVVKGIQRSSCNFCFINRKILHLYSSANPGSSDAMLGRMKNCSFAAANRISNKIITTVCLSLHNKSSLPNVITTKKYSSISDSDRTDPGVEEIKTWSRSGLLQLSVPLPSRNETCLFTLKPLSNNLSDFIEYLKIEDHGVEHVRIYSSEGVSLANSTSIVDLFQKDFFIDINSLKYVVRAQKIVELFECRVDTVVPSEEQQALRDVVARLYGTIHNEQQHHEQQRRLQGRLEELQLELEPLEKIKHELHVKAAKKTNFLSWVGLSCMGLQFGILGRLTWWEYSWDVMEPVTYFVTCGTAMAMFSYYIVTKQEYIYPEVHDRQLVRNLHKLAKKNNFDIDRYNRICVEIDQIKFDLGRLNDRLQLQLNPPHIPPQH